MELEAGGEGVRGEGTLYARWSLASTDIDGIALLAHLEANRLDFPTRLDEKRWRIGSPGAVLRLGLGLGGAIASLAVLPGIEYRTTSERPDGEDGEVTITELAFAPEATADLALGEHAMLGLHATRSEALGYSWGRATLERRFGAEVPPDDPRSLEVSMGPELTVESDNDADWRVYAGGRIGFRFVRTAITFDLNGGALARPAAGTEDARSYVGIRVSRER